MSPSLKSAGAGTHGQSATRGALDETYLKIKGQWVYLYRAVDKAGRTVDFLLSKRRDVAAAKSRQARLAAQKKLLVKSAKSNAQTKDSTLESSGYIFVFTTLASSALSATQALELYRGRWQIELVFKRLKSILSLGYLRKVDPDSARSWLEGKLFVAMLIEALLAQAESFFPWGYPLGQNAVHAVNGGNSAYCFTLSSRALIRT